MGILDKIKKALIGTLDNEPNKFEDIIRDAHKEHIQTSSYFYDVKVANLTGYKEVVSRWNDDEKFDFVLYCIKNIYDTTNKNTPGYTNDRSYQDNQLRFAFIYQIFRTKLEISGRNLNSVVSAIYRDSRKIKYSFQDWRLTYLINQVERQYKGKLPDEELKRALTFLKIQIEESGDNIYIVKDKAKLIEKIDSVLFEQTAGQGVKPTLFLGDDSFTVKANSSIGTKPDNEKAIWYQLIAKAQKATGSKPSKKYIAEAKELITALGTEKFKKTVHEWFQGVMDIKETVVRRTHTYRDGSNYNYSEIEFISALNTETLKGFVWMCSLFHDRQTIQTVSKLAERCYKKIPEKGAASAGIGNACLYTLASSKGLDGIGQLSRLRLKIKQNNTLKLIENYIREAADKMGISNHEIEDIAADDFKLKDNKRLWQIENLTAVVEVTGIGKSVLTWVKEGSKEQKSVPAIIKEKHGAALKKIKDTQKQIDQATVTQRDRLDRMLRSDRIITMDYFEDKYLNHGLLNGIISKLIFNFSNDSETVQAIGVNGQWKNNMDEDIDIKKYNNASLWHPATSTTANVKQWRDYLIKKQILQPFKQAFREIYLLTEAEINTRTYSNRMASHILKQHQYVTLAKGRNWTSRLIGAWDGGDMDTATLSLPEYNLKAEYWVNALNADDAFNDTGIWNYVTTDQIRFVDTQTNEAVDLVNVPAVAFSEVLRDVDLFVGVASVGNDPTWQDSGGLPAYRDYWQSYSFGDLSEVAKNRKEILTGLIPRLKIAGVTSIEDKFVVVRGKLRTYKIHLGSTNILMEPNDQYLCIVPDRSKKDTRDNIYLPFEGDNGLSIILSKAFLLAEDNKITDSTIVSQINR